MHSMNTFANKFHITANPEHPESTDLFRDVFHSVRVLNQRIDLPQIEKLYSGAPRQGFDCIYHTFR